MQYLSLTGNETFASMSRMFSATDVNAILIENGLPRVFYVAEEWYNKCQVIIQTTPPVSAEAKINLLNILTDNQSLFEKACLMDEDEWKVFFATQAFTDALKLPASVTLPSSQQILGDNNLRQTTSEQSKLKAVKTTTKSKKATTSESQRVSSLSDQSKTTYTGGRVKQVSSSTSSSTADTVSSELYKNVVQDLRSSGTINTSRFSESNKNDLSLGGANVTTNSSTIAFNIPWGKIQMYSTVLQELIDFPVYPDQVETGRQASYTSMPDIIYQYEPWITFQNSGPREQALDFHMHRDMWTGDHRDGLANKLIRFCEANTFADYNGSAVITPLIRFYVDGTLFISGVITSTRVTWSGPIGLDNWYLEFTLSLAIQEISESALNVKSVYARELKEG